MPNGVCYRTDSLLFISLFGSNKASLDTKGKCFILVLLSMVLVVVFSPSEAANKFSVISSQIYDYWYLDPQETTKTSVGARLVIWEVALFDIIPSHLLFGVGDVRQLDWINLITVANVDTDFWERILHFHNEGINIFVTGGLLLFLVSNWLLYKLFQAARGEPVLLCLLVGSVSWGVTEVAFFHKNYFFVFLSLWLLYECALHNDRNRRAS